MKKLLIGVAVVVLVLAAAAYFLIASLDTLIEAAIEKYGSEATGARVGVDAVRISLRTGEGGIRGLQIGSPPGFEAPHSFALGEVRVALDTASVTANPVVVKEIRIESPHLIYEWAGRDTNLGVIQKNVSAFAARHAAGEQAEEPAQAAAGERRLVIENLIMRGGRVEVSSALLAGGRKEASFPDVHLKDIGRKQGGVTAAELTAEILKAMTGAASVGVARLDVDALRRQAGAAASKALGEAVDRGVEGAGEAVKDLFDR